MYKSFAGESRRVARHSARGGGQMAKVLYFGVITLKLGKFIKHLGIKMN